MTGLYWEERKIGAEFVSSARTITETDIINFAGISGDYNPLHIDEEFCGLRSSEQGLPTVR